MAVAVTQARTPGQRYGDDTGAFSNFLKGDTLQIVGVDKMKREEKKSRCLSGY